MSSFLSYNPNNYIISRAISLVYEGMKITPSIKHNKNICEKFGDGLLYLPENLPKTIKKTLTNPQVIAIIAFATLHLTNSYAFYPQKTEDTLKFVAEYLPKLSLDVHGRFAAWLSISSLITGACARFGGRLTPDYIAKLAAKTLEEKAQLQALQQQQKEHQRKETDAFIHKAFEGQNPWTTQRK